ncbi:alpha/beta fold hydrolase [Amycolatopsis regifaucium]
MLLDAAISVVASEGLRGLTYKAIDDEAGVATGSTSFYFRTRKELLQGVAERIAEHELAGAETMLASPAMVTPSTIDQTADTIAGALLQWLGPDRKRTKARLEIWLQAAEQPELRTALAPVRDRFLAHTRTLLAPRGKTAAQVEEQANLILSMIDGITYDTIVHQPSTAPDRATLRRAVKAILLAVIGPARIPDEVDRGMPMSSEIRPFSIAIPQADLDDLRERLGRVRWPAGPSEDDWNSGVSPVYLRELSEYWRTRYDWRAHEAELNGFPQFTTAIDGANVHFLHVRSTEPNALPLILSHGWPGSIAEFTKIIGPLTNPREHGGDPADAFHLVIPSLPGFGFSGPPPDAGWSMHRMAHAFAELMARLGYDQYGAQGGDLGFGISHYLGVLDPDHVLGVHVNTLLTVAPPDPAALAELDDEDQERLQALADFGSRFAGYRTMQATRPQTLAYALADSPVGQLAWIVDLYRGVNEAQALHEDTVDWDYLLTTTMLYWLTNTAGSSARVYREERVLTALDPSTVPMGVAQFPHDARAVRRLAEREYSNIVSWTEFDRGGHFAAMEQPDLLVDDIRAFFRAIRRPPHPQ